MSDYDKLIHLKNEAFMESLRQEGRDDSQGLIATLEAKIDQFWDGLWNRYNIESREQIEKDTTESWVEGTSPLNVALHYIWKREPKVKELVEALQALYDEQNGPPLIRHQANWHRAMHRADELLTKHKESSDG